MALECDRAELPHFVALDLNKLPPVSVDCIDVSALMRKQQLMEMEMTEMKTMMNSIMQTVNPPHQLPAPLGRPEAAAGGRSAAARVDGGGGAAAVPRSRPPLIVPAPDC
ncbi:hypothetical protein FJT64_000991 [Amphibalanus amphitrite]|uniref:Uncharacterized protein n=1 Tax=Amphibalanus amphitrite TaxID=1232801 RepID=A0A6A4VRQ7_AMPAM|nr:hypothetical protein FJT64_000991 [Amphibalanus amphitrite]